MAGSLPSKGRIGLPARRLFVRKIKEVLRLKFDVGLRLRQIAEVARSASAPHTSICSGPKLPRSSGRLDRSGMMTGLRPRCSAGLHAAGQRCSPCLTRRPSSSAATTCALDAAVALGRVRAGKPGWLPVQPFLRAVPTLAAENRMWCFGKNTRPARSCLWIGQEQPCRSMIRVAVRCSRRIYSSL